MEKEKNINVTETEDNQNNDKPKSKRKKLNGTQKILIAGFSIIIVGGGVLGYALLNKKDPTPTMKEQIESGNFIIDDSNFEKIRNTMDEKVSDGMFECSMNTVWHFPDNKSASTDAYVANAYTNHKPFYFDVQVGEQTIYTSTLLPVGTSLKELVIDSDLPSGTYEANCTYHLMNELDDGTYKEGSQVTFIISIIIN